jgi:hypothetical protein
LAIRPINRSVDENRTKTGYGRALLFLGGTVFDSEATGVLRKIQTDLKFVFLLVIPDFGVSTAKAYQQLNYS